MVRIKTVVKITVAPKKGRVQANWVIQKPNSTIKGGSYTSIKSGN